VVSVAKFERSHFFSWPYGKSKEDYEKSCGVPVNTRVDRLLRRRMCLAPKAQHSYSALGSAQGRPSMQSISAEGAIHWRVESRFQRSFGM
jgi:hypothetical protein